jgi:hypothetical protein
MKSVGPDRWSGRRNANQTFVNGDEIELPPTGGATDDTLAIRKHSHLPLPAHPARQLL